MSAGAHTLTVAPRRQHQPAAADAGSDARNGRPWVQPAAFAALSLYGLMRWSTMLHPAPAGRLIGLFALALSVAVAVPLVARLSRPLAVAVTVALVLTAFPIAGLPWHSFTHVRIAVTAGHIADGLQALPGVLVPYVGAFHPVRLVVMLGAAVLLLDAAVVAAFAPRTFGDARRAGTALPLVALAVVPSTLVRPQLPYLQGLLLFALLAAFMWGDRVRRDAVGAALVVALVAGVGAAVAAPRVDPHTPWVDYRAWAGSPHRTRVDAFNWNQTYGPLQWPRTGHEVMTVRAKVGDYWKAQDLDLFNGTSWTQGSISIAGGLPAPDPSALHRWTQKIRVTIEGMRTDDVIAAGYATPPASIGGAEAGTSPGTWTAPRQLGPGTSYEVSTYSPSPSATELQRAGDGYPTSDLVNYVTLQIPEAQRIAADYPAVVFPAFHSGAQPYVLQGGQASDVTRMVQSSPYGGAYALARQLAARAATPYAFVQSVRAYLAHGYRYNENPPLRAYPLESFLFTDRLGYCQQFSGAMALLLRMGGIPARVAAGFTSGSLDNQAHTWAVSDINAHAWVEAWFPHYGWVRFDPTPGSAPARGGKSTLPAFVKNLPGETGSAVRAPRRELLSSAQASTPAHRAVAVAGGGTSPLLIVAAAVAVLALVGLVRVLLAPPMTDAQLLAELERAMARSGRPLQRGVTLADLERRFRDSPAAVGYVRTLRMARYGAGGGRPSPAQRRALRKQLRDGLGLSGRLRALWALPPRPALAPRRRTGS